MAELRLAEGIKFGSSGNFSRLEPQGWAQPEENPILTWTTAAVSQLRFAANIPRGRMQIRLVFAPFIAKGVRYQDATFYLNGLWLGFVRARERTICEFPIPREAWNPRDNILSVVVPGAIAPADLGVGADTRSLGLAFEQMMFKEA